MKHIRTYQLRLAITLAVVAPLMAMASVPTSASASVADRPCTEGACCSWSEWQLPRTPDAIEGWYRSCERQPSPGSPDGVEARTR